jgi:tetratricopeptide (TPR) repeat protein
LSDAVAWLGGKFVDFINTLIDVANKIPFVDIGKLTNVFEEQAKIVEDEVTPAIEGYADAELEVAEAIAEAAYQQQLANLDYEEAERLMDELHPTLDDVTAAIGRTNDAMARHHEAQQFISDMNTDLIDEFNFLFGIFDNDEAVDNFSDAILDAAEAVKQYGEGSREAEEASRDIYRELGKVIDQLDNIPATKQLELIALLDQGEYDAVLAQLEVLNAIANTALTTLTAAEIAAAAGMVMPRTGFESLASPVSSIDIGGGASGRFGQTPMGSPMNVVVNMPAGSDGDAVVRSLQDYARKNGAVPVAVDDTRRF